MRTKIRIGIAVLALGATLGAANVAAAQTCAQPQGNHNGWEDCSATCQNPRGNHYGWEACSECCEIPRGEITGWSACE